MANYSQDIQPRLNLLEHHSKKPCLHGQCDTRNNVRCFRHQDTAAIVRRYLRMQKDKATSITEQRIEQTMGTYRHADRVEWRRRFPI